MTSIFPNTNAGGLIVRDPDTGAQIEQPDVYNVSVPVELNIDCDMTALPEDCRARVEPQQVNAIVSELINFFVAMAPGRTWECTELDNLAEAFRDFVENFAGDISGTLTCSVPESDGTEPMASIIYCDGETLRKWTIAGEDGLLEAIQTMLCASPTVTPTSANDRFLYCDSNGAIKNSSFLSLQIYLGEWVQNRAYTTNNLVRKYGKLWSPNEPIVAGTDFVIGDVGQTWYEIAAPGDARPYEATAAYHKDAMIVRGNHYYAANNDIPPNTAFAVGTAGATWRETYLNNRYLYDFNAAISYAKDAIVSYEGGIYRALNAMGPGAWVPAAWVRISGERNIYRGPWAVENAYVVNDAVERDGRLYAANGTIVANSPWLPGQTGPTWRELSPSAGIAYNPNDLYGQDVIVSYNGALYVSNGNIPANTPPEPANIGSAGATWRPFAMESVLRDFDVNKTYVAGQLVAFENEIPGQKSVVRFTAEKLPGPMGSNETLGERNKYRHNHDQTAAYKLGDLVRKDNSGYAYGAIFEANTDIAAGTAFAIGDGPNQWSAFNLSGLLVGVFEQSMAYQAGDFVLARSGIYEALEDMVAGTPLMVGDTGQRWRSYSTGRPTQRYDDAVLTSDPDHRNAYLFFNAVAAQTYTIQADSFMDGDTVSGASINGQLTLAAGPGVVIYNRDSMTLIEADGAAFYLRCIGANEFVLSGDFMPI